MRFLRNRKVRAWILQIGYVLILLGAVVAGAIITKRNLDAQGISSSFDFLWSATGWDLTSSMLPTATTDPYWWFLLMGFVNTLFMGIVGLTGATIVGGMIGLARVSSNKAAQLLGTIYVEIFRNIPMIVQLFFIYAWANQLPSPRQAFHFAGFVLSNRGLYIPGLNVAGWSVALFYFIVAVALIALLVLAAARPFRRLETRTRRAAVLAIVTIAVVLALPTLLIGHEAGTPILTVPELAGLNIRGGYRIRPEFYALAFAIAIYGGAYIAEIVRGGFNSVDRGQTEAAQSLGLTPWQSFIRIRLPLALRSMLPILANQYIWLVKATTLGIAVGYADLFMVIASSITQSGQTLAFIAILMGAFLLLNFTIAAIFNAINKAVALKGHQLRS